MDDDPFRAGMVKPNLFHTLKIRSFKHAWTKLQRCSALSAELTLIQCSYTVLRGWQILPIAPIMLYYREPLLSEIGEMEFVGACNSCPGCLLLSSFSSPSFFRQEHMD